MNDNRSASEKIALVTGAGSGIGKAAARSLLKGGFSVVLAGRRKEILEAAVLDIGGSSQNTLTVPVDITAPQQVIELFKAIANRFARLDILFNNAGVGAPGVPLEDLSFENWKAVVDTNLTGAFLCTQGAFRMMKNQEPRGGRIINNGSVSVYTPRPNSAAYTATKHAIWGLTKSTSLDGRNFNIACGQIDIGNAATEMTSRQKTGVRQADGSMKAEPLMDVNLVGDAVLQMAQLPLDANILSMTIMATTMPLVGRG